ncbi:MAG TPA: hypothetical protein PKM64_04130 [Thermoanaerobaculia bacterium]|nr:hypothetical protein [Thermoanaerobaculia bacterium]
MPSPKRSVPAGPAHRGATPKKSARARLADLGRAIEVYRRGRLAKVPPSSDPGVLARGGAKVVAAQGSLGTLGADLEAIAEWIKQLQSQLRSAAEEASPIALDDEGNPETAESWLADELEEPVEQLREALERLLDLGRRNIPARVREWAEADAAKGAATLLT